MIPSLLKIEFAKKEIFHGKIYISQLEICLCSPRTPHIGLLRDQKRELDGRGS